MSQLRVGARGRIFSSSSPTTSQATAIATAADPPHRIPTVIVYDNFESQSSHGSLIQKALDRHGFAGRVVAAQSLDDRLSLQRTLAGLALLLPLPGLMVRLALSKILETDSVNALEKETDFIEKQKGQAVENCAVNLSHGTSPAKAVSWMYEQVEQAWSGDSQYMRASGESLAKNYARAFNLNSFDLLSSKASRHGPERQKLQQALVNFATSLMAENKAIQAAKKKFESEVVDFELSNNSVVISAGNQGEILEKLSARNHNRNLIAPEGFFSSALNTESVTVVGATRWSDSKSAHQVRASYTNQDSSIGVYALGEVDCQGQIKGTSFASPRVAATMAQLHSEHPEKSSGEVERLMQEQLTYRIDSDIGTVRILKTTEKPQRHR